VWDDERRAAVIAAIEATPVPYARAVAEHVERAARCVMRTRGSPAHTQACEATAVRREQSQELLDRRMTCLDERRAAMRALVDVLTVADAAVVESGGAGGGRAAAARAVRRPGVPAGARAAAGGPGDGAAGRGGARAGGPRARADAGGQAGAGAEIGDAAEATADDARPTRRCEAEVDRLQGELLIPSGELRGGGGAAGRGVRDGAGGRVRRAGGDLGDAADRHGVGSEAQFAVGEVWQGVAAAEVARLGDPLAAADLAHETGNLAIRAGDYPRGRPSWRARWRCARRWSARGTAR
jgi:hypothetical protein